MKIGNSKYELNHIYNEDCLQAMKQIPDKYFELAIVDPPYGINISSNPIRQKHKKKKWDEKIPNEEYFDELFRVSKNQIIWGGNYFNMPATQNYIIWNKLQPMEFSLAMCELAWCSIQRPIKMFTYSVLIERNKIHPTQKPVALYEWLLKNYAQKGDKILDTHLGSASSIIACKKLGFEYLGFELDSDYFKSASERIAKFESQENMFDTLNEQKQEVEQITLSLKDNKSVE